MDSYASTLSVLCWGLCAFGFWSVIKFLWATSKIDQDHKMVMSKPTVQMKLLFLCPMFNEQKTVIDFLTQLKSHVSQKHTVCLVTTANEIPPHPSKSTNEIVQQIRLPDNFVHLHYSGSSQSKSDQMNFALSELKDIELYDYVVCLDSDSTNFKDFPTAIIAILEDKSLTAAQQPLLWYKNYDKYDNTLSGQLMKAFCHLQSWHSISYEIPMIYGWPFDMRLRYLIGHGMIVKMSKLKILGGFPLVADDTRLGKVLDFRKEAFALIPSYGIVESAPSIGALIKQMSTWFLGCSLGMKDFRASRADLTPANLYKIVYDAFKQARWISTGPILVISFFTGLMTNNIVMVTASICGAVMQYSIPTLIMMSYSSKNRAIWGGERLTSPQVKDLVWLSALSVLHSFLSGVALLRGVALSLLYSVSGKLLLYKTER